jgi:hypothetical protein
MGVGTEARKVGNPRMLLQHMVPAPILRMLCEITWTQYFVILGLEEKGGGGGVARSPRSSDLTPLDFFMWGHLHTLIYETSVEREENLAAIILPACATIQNTPGMFDRLRQNIMRRCNAYNEGSGRHFEQLLWSNWK